MINFSIYFQLGFEHIMNWGAFDHILFMAALSLRYQFSDWKKLLILVTAFTIGHTITLGLSVLDIIHFSSKWIEVLIPLTIVATASSNFFIKKLDTNTKFYLIYLFALCFGFIHGLGFSNDLKSIIGNDTGLMVKLFAANAGIEIAQLCFVFILLVTGFICNSIFKISRNRYIVFLSSAVLTAGLFIAIQRILS